MANVANVVQVTATTYVGTTIKVPNQLLLVRTPRLIQPIGEGATAGGGGGGEHAVVF
ncbi:MAG TPA: hypothetical protein VIX41_03360 [Acidimicrobiales bacterium]